MPSGGKPLPEPVLTQFYVAIWRNFLGRKWKGIFDPSGLGTEVEQNIVNLQKLVFCNCLIAHKLSYIPIYYPICRTHSSTISEYSFYMIFHVKFTMY